MNHDKTNKCNICGEQIDSHVTMKKHLMVDHTLQQRIDTLYDRVDAEDTLTGV